MSGIHRVARRNLWWWAFLLTVLIVGGQFASLGTAANITLWIGASVGIAAVILLFVVGCIEFWKGFRGRRN